MSTETIFSIFLGLGLAASTGFRVFLPLFALSLASYFGHIPLNGDWEWVGSGAAVAVLGLATLFEIFAYLIPWFDNLLDTVAVPLAAIAGTAVVVATVADLDPVVVWSLAIIAGGGTATAIQGATSAGRLTSTAGTGGVANPAYSAIETASAATLTAASIFWPVVGIILVIIVLTAVFFLYRKMRPRRVRS